MHTQTLIQYFNQINNQENNNNKTILTLQQTNNNKNSHQQQQQIKGESEICYQVDSEQWFNLGQIHSSKKLIHQQSSRVHVDQLEQPINMIQRQVLNRPRSKSINNTPPPIPPRRILKNNTMMISTKDTRPIKKTSRELTEFNKKNNKQIDLNQFRKSIQSLWFTLLDQHYSSSSSSSSSSHRYDDDDDGSLKSSHHVYYDDLDRKILLPGSSIRQIWLRSQIPLDTLSLIWDSIDKEKIGRLNFEQFLLGMYQISKLRQEEGTQIITRRTTSEDKQPESSNQVNIIRRRRTPPLVPTSRSGSISSCSDSNASSFLPPPPPPPPPHPFVQSLKPTVHPFFDLDLVDSPCNIIQSPVLI